MGRARARPAAHRVDRVVDVDDLGVVERAHDVVHAVDALDVAEEVVAEPLPLRRAAHEPRDVDDLEMRRVLIQRLPDRGEVVVPRVGQRAARLVGLDRAKGVVLGGDRLLREQVEERALADVGQPDHAHLERVAAAPEARGGRLDRRVRLFGRHLELRAGRARREARRAVSGRGGVRATSRVAELASRRSAGSTLVPARAAVGRVAAEHNPYARGW